MSKSKYGNGRELEWDDIRNLSLKKQRIANKRAEQLDEQMIVFDKEVFLKEDKIVPLPVVSEKYLIKNYKSANGKITYKKEPEDKNKTLQKIKAQFDYDLDKSIVLGEVIEHEKNKNTRAKLRKEKRELNLKNQKRDLYAEIFSGKMTDLFNQSEILDFDGAKYERKRDVIPLTKQMKRIMDVLKDGDWHTVDEIQAITGDPATSISAQCRNIRKERFGGHNINGRYREGTRLYEYQFLNK